MQFLYSLIILSTAVGVGSLVCPSVMRDAVRGALGVLLISSLILPFVGAVSTVVDFDIPETGGEVSDGFSEITALAFSQGVKDAITEEFSLDCEVQIVMRGFSPTELLAERITVVIPTSAAFVDFRAVREYTEKNFTRVGGCEVVYG